MADPLGSKAGGNAVFDRRRFDNRVISIDRSKIIQDAPGLVLWNLDFTLDNYTMNDAPSFPIDSELTHAAVDNQLVPEHE